MQIDLSKEEYQTLANALQVAGVVYGVLGDIVDKKFKKQCDDLDSLEHVIFSKAGDFDFEEWVEEFNGHKVGSEQLLNKALDDLREYDMHAFWEELTTRLAQRELDTTYNRAARRAMGEEALRHKYWELIDKWGDILEKQGMDCLEIKAKSL